MLLQFKNNVLHVEKLQPKYFTYGKLFCLEDPFKWDKADMCGWKNHFLGSGGQTYQWVSVKISSNISKKKIFVLVGFECLFYNRLAYIHKKIDEIRLSNEKQLNGSVAEEVKTKIQKENKGEISFLIALLFCLGKIRHYDDIQV